MTVAKEPVSTFASTIHFIPVDGFSSTNGAWICAHGAGNSTFITSFLVPAINDDRFRNQRIPFTNAIDRWYLFKLPGLHNCGFIISRCKFKQLFWNRQGFAEKNYGFVCSVCSDRWHLWHLISIVPRVRTARAVRTRGLYGKPLSPVTLSLPRSFCRTSISGGSLLFLKFVHTAKIQHWKAFCKKNRKKFHPAKQLWSLPKVNSPFT